VNEQKPPNAIEWTRVYGRRGYTWNVTGGCHHGCAWEMPDGTVAECYAKTVAEKFQRPGFFEQGFEHHYFNPERLEEPKRLKEGAGIFADSMADLFGLWVPDDHVYAVLDVMRETPQHIYFTLTKNAPRLNKFADAYPPNLWLGVSMPPTFMWDKRLRADQQLRMFERSLQVLEGIRNDGLNNVLWLSLEPLSFDVSKSLDIFGACIDWLVIGAASNGPRYYQPDPAHVQGAHDAAELWEIPVFHKGNLKWPDVRREFPVTEEVS
jgi:protein gp37